MTADAFSDLVLFAVCAWLARVSLPTARACAGLGIAYVLIGLAALLGVLRFSSWSLVSDLVQGAHQFASLAAAVGAFPILAYSLAYPDSALARRLSGAWWLTFVVGGMGVAFWILGVKSWAQVVPALCGLWIATTAVRRWQGRRKWLGVAGVGCLFASFAVVLLMPPGTHGSGLLSRTQLLHYSLALALSLIHSGREQARDARTAPPEGT